MKWFSVAEQPKSFLDLPVAFATAQALWTNDREGNIKKISGLLQPFLKASLVLDNISNWKDLIDEACVDEWQEIAAESVSLVGVDFFDSPVPRCKAEAIFSVTLIKNLESKIFKRWQDENSYLYDALVFSWDIPKTGALEDLDLTSGTHLGAECFVVNGR